MLKQIYIHIDGCLIDSFQYVYEAYRRAFEKIGTEISKPDFQRLLWNKSVHATITEKLLDLPVPQVIINLHRESDRVLQELLADRPVVLADSVLVALATDHLEITTLTTCVDLPAMSQTRWRRMLPQALHTLPCRFMDDRTNVAEWREVLAEPVKTHSDYVMIVDNDPAVITAVAELPDVLPIHRGFYDRN